MILTIIIELGYPKISRFENVLQINYLLKLKAVANNNYLICSPLTNHDSTSSNNC